MELALLHHVSVVAKDLDRSIDFYRNTLGLKQIPRPPFTVAGAWFAIGPAQVHIVANPGGTFRATGISTSDVHFAFRVEDFERAVGDLAAHGFREDAPWDDPGHLLVIRNGLAGFSQAYLLDPDRHVIEINDIPPAAG